MASKKTVHLEVDDLVDQLMVLGSSMVYLAKDNADDIISELEKRGVLNSEEGKKAAIDLKEKFHEKKDKLYGGVMDQAKKVVDDLGIATKDDLKR